MGDGSQLIRTWLGRCEAAGLSGARGTSLEPRSGMPLEDLESFHDRAGQRNVADRALLARLKGIAWQPSERECRAPDAELWRRVLQPSKDAMIEFSDSGGPLWPELVNEGIEAWTLAELRGLHALWWLSNAWPNLRARALSAAEWQVVELQPDNSTNRPWAIHVFVVLAQEQPDSGAELHAQTLLHNALMTGGGTPEIVSAAILLDAAAALQRELTA